MVDCYDTTMAQEGGAGLFKGFGALILQFSAHYAVLKLTKLLFTQVATFVKSSSPPPPPIEKLRTPVKPEYSKESVRTPMR